MRLIRHDVLSMPLFLLLSIPAAVAAAGVEPAIDPPTAAVPVSEPLAPD